MKTKRIIDLRWALPALLVAACGANEGILSSGKETPVPSDPQSSRTAFEQEIEAMRTADFRFVYVLRRKDGGPIDADDKASIKINTVDANRRVAADDGKAFIIGTNNPIPPAKMLAVYGRFAVEDRSPPRPLDDSNINANAAK